MSQTSQKRSEQWPRVQVGDVADLLRGVSYGKEDATYEPLPTHVPVLRATNIQDAQLVLDSDMVYIAKHNVSDVQRLRAGDIVLATSSGSKHLVGKSALLRHSWGGSFGAFCAALRPKASIDARYLAAYLQSPAYWKEIRKKALGVNINNLRRADLETLTFQLPPLDEQETIVAEIEKQFSRLDEAVANLKRVKANLKRYKAAVLKAAVEGRLVPTEAELARRDERAYESADLLLRRALQQRQVCWAGRGKYKEPPFCNHQEGAELPNGWTWASVEQLTILVTSGSRGWSEFYSAVGVLFIRAQDIKTDSLSLGDIARVDVPVDAEGTRSSVNCGDILVTITGANVTKSALVPELAEKAFVSQHVALLKFSLRELSAFAFLWIISPANGRKVLERWAYGAGKPGLSLEQVRALPIALPPLAEQCRIVAEVDRRLSLAREIQVEVDANLKRAERLRSSILARTFGRGINGENNNAD